MHDREGHNHCGIAAAVPHRLQRRPRSRLPRNVPPVGCRWCGPCKFIAPTVHELAEEYGINVARVDVDKAQELSKKYEITGMPTFKLLNGTIDNYEQTIVGANKTKLEEMFARAL